MAPVRMPSSPLQLVVVGLALASSVTACAPDAHEPVGEIASAIVKGAASDDSQNAVVLVERYDAVAKGAAGGAGGCSGTMLTPRLVLTARHCVSMTDDGAACDGNGKAIQGGAVTGDYPPSAIFVFGGKERPDIIGGTAHPSIGQEILTTGATTLCNEDLALVLLATPVVGATIAPIRLDGGPKKGETITAVGWGVTDTEPTPPARQQRTGITIVDVGPAAQLGPAEFTVGEGPCSGDSGSPALSAAGAVIGSLSRGGNNNPGTAADKCLGSDNIYVQAAAHADFIRSGYAKAGQAPWLEGTPNPTLAALGLHCETAAECASSACDAETRTCTQSCSAAACPGGYACVDHAAGKVCIATLPASPSAGSGCSAGTASTVSPSARARALAWLAMACALAVLFRARAARKT